MTARLSEAQRRLAAIMFTDMVGYTALGQRNESLSLALVEEQRKLIRPVLSRHGGREVKTIGDAFLVEFQSALDAVRCAYDIQRATREFNISQPEDKKVHLRVGIHLGDVVESGGDISGDAVNVASRIEPLATDGGVCLTRQVYDHVQNKFELSLVSLGARPLKNVSTPIEVFRMEMPWEKEGDDGRKEHNSRRVAVLPFANMSPDPGDEYFADGMTEELITSLSGVGELTVIARTSVMKYKGGGKGVSEIAKELNAGTLVEGSVRKAANRVRITVQLIDARNEGHLWAQNYDRQLDDVFAIQSDVARQVAEALQVRLLSTERKKLERMPTRNIDAYTLYLKGNYHANRGFGRPEGLKAAILHYEEAVANDPGFAFAYAELAWCYGQLGFFGLVSPREAGSKAKEYAEKALSLDDTIPEAHHAMGRILRNYDWDFKGAEREFERAIELNPSFAEAQGASALMLAFNRRPDEASAKVRRLLELDPVSTDGASYAGTIFLYSGHPSEAVEQFSRVLKEDPDSPYSRINRGLAYILSGSPEVGLEEVRKWSSIDTPSSQGDLAFALAKTGHVEELREQLGELLETVKSKKEFSVAVAAAYANIGDAEHAIEWLETAYSERVPFLVTANSDFAFDGIRHDPRFQAVMRKMGWTNTT